jgi:hypothetical protein
MNTLSKSKGRTPPRDDPKHATSKNSLFNNENLRQIETR